MNTKKKRTMVEWAMHYRQIIILTTCCLIAFGIYSLPNMRKNEFPDFTIRQGIVVAVAPGNTSEEMVEQVTKPLEDYIFSYKEVKKEKTISKSRDGIVYIQVELNDDLNNKDEFWSKFKHGIATFKSQLPSNVLAVQVMDDFGDTSALLITMESEEKTYRELDEYMDVLQERLRRIPSVGRMSVSGLRKEQISIYIDPERLSQYGLGEKTLSLALMQKGFATTGGRVNTEGYTCPIYVAKSLNTLYDVQQQIIYTDPQGNNIRLKDVARVVKEYPQMESSITNNGKKCILLSVEMKKGQNIVKMGEDINAVLDNFQKELPQDVSLFRITDQSQVVGDSVVNFLRELLIAILAVVLVVMILLPMRVALVAASTIPITIFISLGLFQAFGIELNTVTLAALIVTLGMIVDNSIVIIDSYLEMIGEGCSRWHASIRSTMHFFKSIFFSMAPVLAIPAFRDSPYYGSVEVDAARFNRESQRDWGAYFRDPLAECEREFIANHHLECLTGKSFDLGAILKTEVVQEDLFSALLAVKAFGFDGYAKCDYVPVYCRNGRWYDVPVNWVQYQERTRTGQIAVAKVPNPDHPENTEAAMSSLLKQKKRKLNAQWFRTHLISYSLR